MNGKANSIPERRTIPKGTVVFREGDRGSEAYLVLQGSVRIFKTINGKRIVLGYCRQSQVFGELALFDDAPRMAAAETGEDTVVMVLSKTTIRDLLDSAPAGLSTVIQSLVATMRTMGDDLATAKARLQELER